MLQQYIFVSCVNYMLGVMYQNVVYNWKVHVLIKNSLSYQKTWDPPAGLLGQLNCRSPCISQLHSNHSLCFVALWHPTTTPVLKLLDNFLKQQRVSSIKKKPTNSVPPCWVPVIIAHLMITTIRFMINRYRLSSYYIAMYINGSQQLSQHTEYNGPHERFVLWGDILERSWC